MLQLLAVTVGVGGAPPPAKESPSEEGEARFRAPNEPAIESVHDLCLIECGLTAPSRPCQGENGSNILVDQPAPRSARGRHACDHGDQKEASLTYISRIYLAVKASFAVGCARLKKCGRGKSE